MTRAAAILLDHRIRKSCGTYAAQSRDLGSEDVEMADKHASTRDCKRRARRKLRGLFVHVPTLLEQASRGVENLREPSWPLLGLL